MLLAKMNKKTQYQHIYSSKYNNNYTLYVYECIYTYVYVHINHNNKNKNINTKSMTLY